MVKDKMKKVLFISYTNFFGGAEYVLWDYIRRIDVSSIYIYTTNINTSYIIP